MNYCLANKTNSKIKNLSILLYNLSSVHTNSQPIMQKNILPKTPTMNHKQQIIQAIKNLDFDALDVLLDDNRSYMDVTKEFFLSKLKQTFERYDVTEPFENIIEGKCNHCYIGQQGYLFTASHCSPLSLVFEEENDKVINISYCKSLITDDDIDKWTMFFEFYDDEKVSFKPSVQHLINIKNVDIAMAQFNKIAKAGLVPLTELVEWYTDNQNLQENIRSGGFMYPQIEHKYFVEIDNIFDKLESVVKNFNENLYAKETFDNFCQIDIKNERAVVKWLLDVDDCYSCQLQKTKNWKKTGILIFNVNPQVVVDCSGYMYATILQEIFWSNYIRLMVKYAPTKKEIDCIKYDEFILSDLLKMHGKYLDLFEE